MCVLCGDTGYKPAMRYGAGTSVGDVAWANYAVREPCQCTNPMSPIRPWPLPLIVPVDPNNTNPELLWMDRVA